MKIELKKISYNERLSHETSAYYAEVWVDGKKRGTTENDGHGGADLIRPHGLEAEINEYAKTLPPIKGYESPLPMSAELIFGELLTAHIARKQLKRLMAKKTVSVFSGAVWSGPPHAGAVVLNTLPFDEALRLYIAHMEV